MEHLFSEKEVKHSVIFHKNKNNWKTFGLHIIKKEQKRLDLLKIAQKTLQKFDDFKNRNKYSFF